MLNKGKKSSTIKMILFTQGSKLFFLWLDCIYKYFLLTLNMEVTRSLQLETIHKPLTTQITSNLSLQSHTHTHTEYMKIWPLISPPMVHYLNHRVNTVRRKDKNLPTRLSCHPLHVVFGHISGFHVLKDAAHRTLLRPPSCCHKSHSAGAVLWDPKEGGTQGAGQHGVHSLSEPGSNVLVGGWRPSAGARPPTPWRSTALGGCRSWHWWRGSWLHKGFSSVTQADTKQNKHIEKTHRSPCVSPHRGIRSQISKAAKPSSKDPTGE